MPRTLPIVVAVATLAGACDSADDPRDTDTDASDASADVTADTTVDAADTADSTETDVGDTSDVGDTDTDDADGSGETMPPCSEPIEGDFVRHDLGGWAVEIDERTGAWRADAWGDSAAPVLANTSRCKDGEWLPLAETIDAEPIVRYRFGSFDINIGPNSAIAWTSYRVPAGVEAEADHVDIVLADDTRLRFAAEGTHLRIALLGATDSGVIHFDCGDDESFFGLGSQSVEMDLRGRTYPLWTQEQGIGKPEGGGIPGLNNIPEAAYAPMGIWHSTAGYSAITTSDGFQSLDLCDSDPTRVTLASYGHEAGLVLLGGVSAKDRITALAALVGTPPMPPRWVFAPWNDAVGGPDRLLEMQQLLRDNDIPSSAIWSEDWIGGEEGESGFRLSYEWDWDQTLYPDLPADIENLHANGFAFLAYFNTFVPAGTPMFAEGEAGDYLVKNALGETYTTTDPAFRTTGFVDLTNPAAQDWFGEYMRVAAEDLGIDGWMADFTEWLPTDAVLHSGESPWTYHNRWPLDFQRLNSRVMNAVHAEDPRGPNDWVYFARSGWASTQGATASIAPTMWGGDQDTDWDLDDGLATIIPIGAHLGLSGVAVFGSDIAGYSAFVSPPTTKELFFRWTSVAAFHPLMRTHHGSSKCANWSFERDAESLEHYRRYAVIHTLLYPVFDALMREAVETGIPITRHPWLVFESLPELWQAGVYQFFVGDDLLVSAVYQPDATTRQVTLPASGWWPLFSTEPLEVEHEPGEPARTSVDAAVTEIPVFVRPGTALPLLFWAPDSFYGATADGVTDLDDVDGQRYFALYPDADGDTRPASDSDVTVVASGLPENVDWADATIDDAAIAPCDDFERTWPCRTTRGVEIKGGATIAIGDGTITVEAPVDSLTGVGFAAQAWGTLAEVPPVPDLDAVAPGWCDESVAR